MVWNMARDALGRLQGNLGEAAGSSEGLRGDCGDPQRALGLLQGFLVVPCNLFGRPEGPFWDPEGAQRGAQRGSEEAQRDPRGLTMTLGRSFGIPSGALVDP